MAHITIDADGFTVEGVGAVVWRDLAWVDGAKRDRLTYEELVLTFHQNGKVEVATGEMDKGFVALEALLAERLQGFDMGWRTKLEAHQSGRIFQFWHCQLEVSSPVIVRGPRPDIGDLCAEIERTFPILDMPPRPALPLNELDWEMELLLDEIETWRGKTIKSPLIYYLHQEWYQLSAETWQWMLPYWLRFCLMGQAEHDGMVVEWLVYSLSPQEDWADQTRRQLGLLKPTQIVCLIHFLEWLVIHPHFSTYFPERIAQAIQFLKMP